MRVLTDPELERLADRACGNVLDDERQHFLSGWTSASAPEFQRSFLQFHWAGRAEWTPEDWHLSLGVFPAGADEPVGVMGMLARDFGVLRSVTTGSWLLRDAQGRGLGTLARGMVLDLAFAHLGAVEARSDAVPDNAASNGVSRRYGYREDGTELARFEDRALLTTRYRLTREDWAPHRLPDVVVSGLDDCRAMFGI